MQIRRKLPIIMNMLICIPLVVLAVVTYVCSSRQLVLKGEGYIAKLAVSEGRALSALAQAKKYQVDLVAQEAKIKRALLYPEDKLSLESAAEYLKKAMKWDEDYEIVLLDKKGQIIVTATGRNEKLRLRSRESFNKVMEGKVSFSDMLFSYMDHNKVINITVPVKNNRGEVIGAVCRVISNGAFSEFTKTIQLGNTGYAFILNEEGYVVAHPNKKKEGSLLAAEGLRKEIRSQHDAGIQVGSYVYRYDHWRRGVSFYVVPEIGWVICVTQSVAEMQEEAVAGSMLIVLTLILLIIVVYFVSRKLTWRIIKPIDLLMEAMEGNEKGKIDKLCHYEGNDEFGTLARTYNEMVRKLGDSHCSLDRVCQELESTKQELRSNYNALEKSQEALVISEERYKVTLDAIDEGIWEYNINIRELAFTENLKKITGIQLENEDVLTIVNKMIDPQYIQDFMKKVKSCIAGETGDFTQEVPVYVEHQRRWLLCKGHAVYTEQGAVRKLIGILTDITDNKVNEEQMRKLSYFDGLTGCLNKATFIETLDGLLSAGDFTRNAVLIFIDLDNFKRINDTLGHDVGDKILNYVGKLLRDILPQDAVIGRFGGDEFVVFKANINNMDEVHELIYDVLNQFKRQIIMGSTKVHVTCSMGVAMCPVDGRDSAMLLKNADTAMYKAKDNGKNTYSFYAPVMTQKLDRRLMIEEALREAIGRDSFRLQYQPIVDAQDQRTIGCEALVRMVDSELGFISPGEFIPIAEETNLIIEAGDWVMENALSALRYYHKQGYQEFYMNINVSSIQIKEEGFLDKLKRFVTEAHVATEFIKLEVTESVLMENIDASIQLFREVKEMGIKIVLDDFGTGYSSLNYLRNIPLDILKIDKSFVDEITTSKVLSEIVDSIINMAHALDIIVVAEGVETESQYEILKEKGCDLIQGYYFGKPLDGELLEERLRKERENMTMLDRIS